MAADESVLVWLPSLLYASQLLGDSCHNLTYRNMYLLKYHWALFIHVQKFFTENDKREQIIIGLSWMGPEKLLRCPSRVPVTSFTLCVNSCN